MFAVSYCGVAVFGFGCFVCCLVIWLGGFPMSFGLLLVLYGVVQLPGFGLLSSFGLICRLYFVVVVSLVDVLVCLFICVLNAGGCCGW